MRFTFFPHIILACLFSFSFQEGKAQQSVDGELQCNPTAVLLLENGVIPGEEVSLVAGDDYTGSAPLEFRFSANPVQESSSLRYEWQFAEDEDLTTTFLVRFDEVTTYTFERSGIYFVQLFVTDTETNRTYISDQFRIQITESDLKVPNAFSPNGDGVNDVFKVRYKSLVRFEAYVFNRWGQEIYRWNLSNIDDGWDGTSGGKPVKNGVYFIMVEAEGADGVVYKHKGDINILR